MNQIAHQPYTDLPNRSYIVSRPSDDDREEASEHLRLLGDEVASLPPDERRWILRRLRERDDLR